MFRVELTVDETLQKDSRGVRGPKGGTTRMSYKNKGSLSCVFRNRISTKHKEEWGII